MFDKAPFKTGERVRVTDRRSDFHGQTGTVQGASKKGKDWFLLLHMDDVPGTPEIVAEFLERD